MENTLSLTKTRNRVEDLLIIAFGGIFISLFAKAQIPLPFTPIPIALQPHIVLLLAALLGSKRASLATLFFLFQGMIGLPVFVSGGFGLAHLAGPTGGYLLGYVVAAYVTGSLIERGQFSKPRLFLSLTIGNLVIYLFGMSWLSIFVGVDKAFYAGMLPFLPGDIIKTCVFAGLISTFKQQQQS